MKLELNDDYVEEVFEILCELPFEEESYQEPTYKRHPGIEQLIEQLAVILPEGIMICKYPKFKSNFCGRQEEKL